jgi:protein tyrosine/serine phosphatase
VALAAAGAGGAGPLTVAIFFPGRGGKIGAFAGRPGPPSVKEDRMSRWLRGVFAALIAALVLAGPWCYYAHEAGRYRNLHVVREGVLLRSAQLPLEGVKQVLREHAIKAVVTLRDNRKTPGGPFPDHEEEKYCKEHGIKYYRLPPTGWSASATPGVRKFLAVMRDRSNYPVLIHCFAGKHRTGAYCAIYRMEIEHWSNEEAIAEMMALGYDNLAEHQDLLNYLRHYQPSWQQNAKR